MPSPADVSLMYINKHTLNEDDEKNEIRKQSIIGLRCIREQQS